MEPLDNSEWRIERDALVPPESTGEWEGMPDLEGMDITCSFDPESEHFDLGSSRNELAFILSDPEMLAHEDEKIAAIHLADEQKHGPYLGFRESFDGRRMAPNRMEQAIASSQLAEVVENHFAARISSGGESAITSDPHIDTLSAIIDGRDTDIVIERPHEGNQFVGAIHFKAIVEGLPGQTVEYVFGPGSVLRIDRQPPSCTEMLLFYRDQVNQKDDPALAHSLGMDKVESLKVEHDLGINGQPVSSVEANALILMLRNYLV